MEEVDVNELLDGYSRTQLRTVWDEPDFINSNKDVWEIDERTTLIVITIKMKWLFADFLLEIDVWDWVKNGI